MAAPDPWADPNQPPIPPADLAAHFRQMNVNAMPFVPNIHAQPFVPGYGGPPPYGYPVAGNYQSSASG